MELNWRNERKERGGGSKRAKDMKGKRRENKEQGIKIGK